MAYKILALEINDETLRYVCLEKKRKQWRVVSAGLYAGEVDLFQTGALARAVNGILAKEKVLPQRLFISVSRKETFIHQIVIPRMSGKEIEEVVLNEIEKNPAFGNKTFDFIYKVFPHKRDQQKVLFAALPQETVAAIIEEITATRLSCHDLELTPLNLKEFVPDSGGQAEGGGPGAVSGLVVVHQSCTHFTIFDRNSYKVLYKIPVGMANIAASGNLLPDESRAFISQLHRIVKSFAGEHRSAPVSELWVVWDSEQAEGLDKLLSDQLGIKASRLNLSVMQNFVLSDDNQLNPIYMLALTPVFHHIARTQTVFPLDHFLRSMHVARYARRSVLGAAVLAAALVFIYAGFHLFIDREVAATQDKTRAVQVQIRDLKKKTEDIYSLYELYRQTRERLLQQATYVRDLNRVSWSQVLAIVSTEMPGDLALTSFSFREGGQAAIKGESYQMETISDLIRKIDTSSILQKGSFNYLKEREIVRRESGEKDKFYQFGITARLRLKVEGEL
jgi:Tfp pilus assembly PilM family ATPase